MNFRQKADFPVHRLGSQERVFGLFAAVAAVLVYLNSLGNGFVWDDDLVSVQNPALRGDAFSLLT